MSNPKHTDDHSMSSYFLLRNRTPYDCAEYWNHMLNNEQRAQWIRSANSVAQKGESYDDTLTKASRAAFMLSPGYNPTNHDN